MSQLGRPANAKGGALQKPEPVSKLAPLQPAGSALSVFDPEQFAQLERITQVLMHYKAIKQVDKKGNPIFGRDEQEVFANCFMIVTKANDWGMDPFALSQEAYAPHGKLAFQGKVIIAAINQSSLIEGNIDFEYEGSTHEDLVCIVSATRKGEGEPKVDRLSWKAAKTANDIWKRDPRQKLAYSAAIRWARKWAPSIVMGVRTEDDVERELMADQQRLAMAKPVETMDQVAAEFGPGEAVEVEDASVPVEEMKVVETPEPAAEVAPEPEPEPEPEPAPPPAPEPEPAPPVDEDEERAPAAWAPDMSPEALANDPKKGGEPLVTDGDAEMASQPTKPPEEPEAPAPAETPEPDPLNAARDYVLAHGEQAGLSDSEIADMAKTRVGREFLQLDQSGLQTLKLIIDQHSANQKKGG